MRKVLGVFLVLVFFCYACGVTEKKNDKIVSFKIDEFGEYFMFENDSVIPSPCFHIDNMSNGGVIITSGWDYGNELRKKYLKSPNLPNINRFDVNRYMNKREMIKRLDACLEFAADKYNLDSLQYIDGFVGDFVDVNLAFSKNVERMTKGKMFEVPSWYKICNIAINATSLKRDLDEMLDKYDLTVDTILIGPDPHPMAVPINDYLKKAKMTPNKEFPKEVIDVGVCIGIKSLKK